MRHSRSRGAYEYCTCTTRIKCAQHAPKRDANYISPSPSSIPPKPIAKPHFFPFLPPDRVLVADGSGSGSVFVFVFVFSGVLKNASMDGCYLESARLMISGSGAELTALPLSSESVRRTTFVWCPPFLCGVSAGSSSVAAPCARFRLLGLASPGVVLDIGFSSLTVSPPASGFGAFESSPMPFVLWPGEICVSSPSASAFSSLFDSECSGRDPSALLVDEVDGFSSFIGEAAPRLAGLEGICAPSFVWEPFAGDAACFWKNDLIPSDRCETGSMKVGELFPILPTSDGTGYL